MGEIFETKECIWEYKGKRVFKPDENAANGFHHGYTAKRILEADHGTGNKRDIFYLVEYEEVDFLEFIPRKVANEKIPQLVIEFLQERLVFKRQSAQNTEI